MRFPIEVSLGCATVVAVDHPFDFGQTLRAYRLARRMNQDVLAERSGLSRQTVSNLENSKVTPRFETVEALCAALGLPVTALEIGKGQQVLSGPPILISPWPPHGITWNEVQIAISDYISERTRRGLEELNESAPEGMMYIIGGAAPLSIEDNDKKNP